MKIITTLLVVSLMTTLFMSCSNDDVGVFDLNTQILGTWDTYKVLGVNGETIGLNEEAEDNEVAEMLLSCEFYNTGLMDFTMHVTLGSGEKEDLTFPFEYRIEDKTVTLTWFLDDEESDIHLQYDPIEKCLIANAISHNGDEPIELFLHLKKQ